MKSYSKKDFEVQWFSGTGSGGQHRNKHQNCCRIIHIETGLRTTGQRSRERSANLADAFRRLAAKLIALDRLPTERRSAGEIVRTYHFEDNQARDHATGLTAPVYAVVNGDLDKFLMSPDREGPRPKSGRA